MTKKTILYPWKSCGLQQTHKSNQQTLIVSGCSFTDCQGRLDHPLTWPGYLMTRVGFDHVVDLSSAGSGNEYICTSVLNQIESMTKKEIENCMVVIMWSGIGRSDLLIKDSSESGARIDDIRYQWDPKNATTFNPGEALRSWKNIIMMQNYLENKKIPFGFSFFVNTFEPPFLPKRAATCGEWIHSINSKEKIKKLKMCNWIHSHQDCIFEYSFKNDLLSKKDLFHPTPQGHLSWTDTVLLPGLVKMGLISAVDQ